MSIPRDVVTVTGPDARTFLHSQLSQDIAAMVAGEERWTFALEPAGKIVALARIRCVDADTFQLDAEVGYGGLLAARLDRFRIRVAVEITTDHGERVGDADEAEAVRVAAGWPAMGSEITPGETIPGETGITADAVNFTKGCYPGQELVERMDSRGAAPPRQLRTFDVSTDVRVGDPIVDPDTGDVVGTFTSVAGGRALGYVRRGSAVGAAPGSASSD